MKLNIIKVKGKAVPLLHGEAQHNPLQLLIHGDSTFCHRRISFQYLRNFILVRGDILLLKLLLPQYQMGCLDVPVEYAPRCQQVQHRAPWQDSLIVAEGENHRAPCDIIGGPPELLREKLPDELHLVIRHGHAVRVPHKRLNHLLLCPSQAQEIVHPALPFPWMQSGKEPEGIGEHSRGRSDPELLHGSQALLEAGGPMHECPGVRGDQLDDDIVRGAVVLEDLDLGEEDATNVPVDEIRGLQDGSGHVLVAAEEVSEDEVVGADAALEAVTEDAGGVGEDEAADLGVGEAELAAEELDLGHEGGVGPVREQGRVRGDEAGDVGGREADAAEEGDDGVRLLGGAQADARGGRDRLILREAAGVAEEVEREGAGLAGGAGGGA